jgi:hypothetical protein
MPSPIAARAQDRWRQAFDLLGHNRGAPHNLADRTVRHHAIARPWLIARTGGVHVDRKLRTELRFRFRCTETRTLTERFRAGTGDVEHAAQRILPACEIA